MKILLLIGVLLLSTLAFDGIRMYLHVKKSSVLVQNSRAFMKQVENPPMRILVLGDSTAVGTGSDSNVDSTAGRLSDLYPNADIENLAVNGLKIAGLVEILKRIETPDKPYDLILIQIGANDIIRFTPLQTIESGISEVLKKATTLGKHVVILHSGDVGQTQFFPWYVRFFHTRWSYSVRDIYTAKATEYHVAYVDLINSSVGEALKENPKKYYATDALHLSGDGYGLWFAEIKKTLPAY